ncbi:MBOAT family protein [Neptunomonas sp.]|uniref:MBOAT family O-acyltransferase n=1 Tax=Neptunomonas sp. TaxID=1971898 RepID=UPI0035693CBF
MLFNSAEFIFAFLPIALFGFFWIAGRFGNEVAILWLVIASLFFYGWWDPSYLLIILMSMLCNYFLGKHIYQQQSKLLLIIGILGNLAVLGYFKYANFLVVNVALLSGSDWSIEKIVLPLAISFFTFQQIAYLVDSYKKITEEYRFVHYALFVTFFPQLIAGPIVHHKEMLPQFQSSSAFRISSHHLAIGIGIFAIGLFKKTVIADGIAVYANPVFNGADAGSSPDFLVAWSAALAYTFQIYFDFSGYSDMALGLARMFGIVLPLNFYSPYKACSISEFWRRWHMTLSRFLRDYIYIPLGGNQKGSRNRYLFLMTTMLLGGLWHGAGWNFVIWGALHGSYLAINHIWRQYSLQFTYLKLNKMVSWLLTMLVVVIAWVFFRANTFDGAVNILQGMAGINGVSLPIAILARLGEMGEILQSWGVVGYHGGATQLVKAWIGCLLLIPVVIFLPNVQDLFSNHKPSLSNIDAKTDVAFWPGPGFFRKLTWQPTLRWASYLSILLVIGVMTLGQISDFLYFQF